MGPESNLSWASWLICLPQKLQVAEVLSPAIPLKWLTQEMSRSSHPCISSSSVVPPSLSFFYHYIPSPHSLLLPFSLSSLLFSSHSSSEIPSLLSHLSFLLVICSFLLISHHHKRIATVSVMLLLHKISCSSAKCIFHFTRFKFS